MSSADPVRLGVAAAVLAGGAGLVPAPGAQAAPEDDAALSALLKRQTEDFSEDGQRGDRAVFERSLDADVVFTNETGPSARNRTCRAVSRRRRRPRPSAGSR